MTTEKALELYNQAKGTKYTVDDFNGEHISLEQNWAREAVKKIMFVSKMTERLGGELKSRQVIAAIIAGC